MTIEEELLEDLEVLTQIQTDGIRRILEEFEDD